MSVAYHIRTSKGIGTWTGVPCKSCGCVYVLSDGACAGEYCASDQNGATKERSPSEATEAKRTHDERGHESPSEAPK